MTDNITPVVNETKPVSDEVSVITEGAIIKGDIVSNGSLDIRGNVQGDIGCNGKLVVTDTVTGNSNSSEFFADAAKIEGEVVSTGTVKIGLGSVIIGNVTSSSAVIAGASKDLPNVFERFYRTDASRNSSKGGSGIGLSIVKKIIEEHGGKIWATSREHTGTTMYFVLRKYQEVPVNE